jgi:hypothetical protein
MVMPRIERSIPLPEPRKPSGHGTARKELFPWRDMEVGDSFRMPDTMTRSRVARRAVEAGYRTGFKFTIRRQPTGYYRIWRIA